MASPESQERQRLEAFKARLQEAMQEIESRLEYYARDVQAQKTYLWESKADMDHVEKISTRASIEQAVMTGEAVLAHRKRLLKLAASPYFGRFDFARAGDTQHEAIYVGVHHFFDERERKNLVYDWRAPISTMFYDHEIGPARYDSPSGEIRGEISLKRQFRIRDGRMDFMLESSVNIMDELLQQELSRASDDGMKNIVATIQRDQNAIIRDEHAPVLIIQGVAGSGKTSIALHRIAFLLYRFKDTLTSKDILIISPNRVFADYISNVLPELGEESVDEIGMEALAAEWLEQKYRFQTFFEQTALLLERNDEEMQRRVEAKASPDFVRQIDAYADHIEANNLSAEDLWVGRSLVPAWFIEETYAKHRGVATAERVRLLVSAIEQTIGIHYHRDITPEQRADVRAAARKMLRQPSLRDTYKGLFDWLGKAELFKLAKGGRLEFADVFPMIYLKLRLEGVETRHKHIKHLLIDEMQDYTPVQYAVLARLFSCNKTILGDANQSVNPYSASKAEGIRQVFRQATCVKLTRSYRSTYEIMQLAQAISPNPDLVAMERHGAAPQVVKCASAAEEIARVCQRIEAFPSSGHRSLGIVCKTQRQADKLFEAVRAAGHDARLLNAESASFLRGVIICTAHMSKGLEFDQVVVPGASDRNYATLMERNMLYVACTRAMHELTLTYVGDPSRFILRACA